MNARIYTAYFLWQNGHDLRIGRSRSAFYSLRRAILQETGDDIKVLQPKSNVVSFPPREIVATQVGRPPWADRLDAALREVALGRDTQTEAEREP